MFSSLLSKIGSAVSTSWKSVSSFVGLGSSDSLRDAANPEHWARAVCRLDLYLNPGSEPPRVGSGFFLNVPGTDKDVLVTAAHNLTRPPTDPGGKPKRTQKIGIRTHDASGRPTTVMATPSDYLITEQYEQSQTPENAVHDYAVILLDRLVVDGKPKPRDAFGFNVLLAAMDLRSKEPGVELAAWVGGYPVKDNKSDAPHFKPETGSFGRHEERQVLFNAGTDRGMSGGPVWVRYEGEEIVVGIQNYCDEVKGVGNRGTRLELRTLQDICRWSGADLGLLDKAIKVNDSKPSPGISKDGLFLQLGSSESSSTTSVPLGYARSGYRRNPLLTTFDILPAQASPSYIPNKQPQFAIVRGRDPNIRRFFQFETDPTAVPRQISGVQKLNQKCLVQLDQGLGPYDVATNPFRILIAPHHQGGTPLYKLVLSPWDIPPYDNTFGMAPECLGLLIRARGAKLTVKEPFEYEEYCLV
ncbi:hypothetical protein FN846DRAFT_973511 [Sphaerosporella brunnea]|uniref:Uncharacterized protein n=1 Tax=Sphaerosporella brunnea TaxID=1250544 RepID=A0A5J5EH73_9PEZI|nr:hypothetical protein FN846DRAFT_973511 [Sphaerosporella brunnea]